MGNFDSDIIENLIINSIRSPQKEAFVILDNNLTVSQSINYRDLASKVEWLSTQDNFKRFSGGSVILFYTSVIDFLIVFFACQKAGIIPIPVSASKGDKQFKKLMNILKDSKSTAIFTAKESLDYLSRSFQKYTDLNKVERVLIEGCNADHLLLLTKDDSNEKISFVQYTSGSTNKPKGVIVSKDSLIHNQRLLANTFICNLESRILTWLPFYHDMGLVGNILHTIFNGCTCFVMSPLHFMQKPQFWLKAITKYRITHTGGPNFAYDLCVDRITKDALKALDLSSWQVAYNGSENVRSKTIARFIARFELVGFNKDAFFPCYGLAESTLLVSGLKEAGEPLTIWIDKYSLPNNQIRLVDPADENNLSLVSAGKAAEGIFLKIISKEGQSESGELEAGEICVAGRSVTNGYWKRNQTDLFYEIDNLKYLRTGDIGFLYKHNLFVCGRSKEMLIIRGRNIFPYDIEESISLVHPTINRNGVVAFTINENDDDLVIVVELKRGLLEEEIFQEIVYAIDHSITDTFHISPFDIVLLIESGIPRTSSGKLQRYKCREDYLSQSLNVLFSKAKSTIPVDIPETHALLVEQVLVSMDYKSIQTYLLYLLKKNTGYDTKSFGSGETELTSVGIDSLKVMLIINAINVDLNIRVDVSYVFENNTIDGLINSIEGLLWIKNRRTNGKEIIL